ncbi:adenylyl-sulfate kinase [Paraburkholderia acidicola]|uniref:adenylyl-sulfate kinase n=1 Tax=Paraburkholderia acidicola TaxID=1912599 RepID=UPI0032DFDAB3
MNERRRGIAFVRSCHDFLRASDFSIAAVNSLRRSIAPAHRVLDTCGRGGAGLLALHYGAGRVVALTAETMPQVDAQESGLDARMSFLDAARAQTLADREGRFDVVLGLTSTGQPGIDLDYGFRLDDYARRFGTANVAVVPNGVRYSAQLVEWGDAGLLESDVETRKRALESRYGIAFDPILEHLGAAAASHDAVGSDAMRALGPSVPFLTCHPGDRQASGAVAPLDVTLTATQSGRADGVVWTQELIHDGIVIKRIQGCSWLDARSDLEVGEALTVPVASMVTAVPFDGSETAPRLASAARVTGAPAPLVFWLTGISGAGKTAIATRFKEHAEADGWPTVVLDGDALRSGLNADLGFSDAHRAENVRRVAEVAALMADIGHLVIVSLISPKRAFRESARTIIGAERFVEVFVDTPPAIAEARDPKGLYRRARAGLVTSFTGIHSSYEPPLNPHLRIDTTTHEVEDAVKMLRNHYIDARLPAVRVDLPEQPVRVDRFGRRFATAVAAGIATADSLTARFAEVAARRRDATALVCGDEHWTYGQLAAHAGRIAAAISAAGGSANEPVALLYPHGAPMIAAMFGVLGAGKFYVPLIADHPLPHLQSVVRECGCRIVLAAPALVDTATQLGVEVRIIDDASLPDVDRALDTRPDDAVSYLLFTSGTTGVPKGVMQCDRNVLHHAACYASSIGLGVDDRMTLLPYYGFDASVMDIFATLLTGASLHIWDVRERGVEGIGEWLTRERITIWHSTPSVLRAAFPIFAQPAALRWVVLGGEAATGNDAVLAARQGGPQCRLLNGLGPTECTTALQYVADPVADASAPRLPVGRPVPGVEIMLLDAAGEVSATEGELAIVSPFVALGYWGRPELSAERFGATARADGARRYRTGDLLRMNPDGCYEHLTRVDDQIKIRGMRVELGEIEAALCGHGDVLQAVALPHLDDVTQQQTIIAYVVQRDASTIDMAVLRAYIAGRLPAHMVPRAVIRLDAIPLLPNGKLNRRALPAPSQIAAPAGACKRPRTPLHHVLAACWADVLRRDSVGIDENFFELGGDSLLGARLLSRVRHDLELDAQLGDLFRHPTVESLASHLLASR